MIKNMNIPDLMVQGEAAAKCDTISPCLGEERKGWNVFLAANVRQCRQLQGTPHPFIVLRREVSKDVQENVFNIEENGSFACSVEI